MIKVPPHYKKQNKEMKEEDNPTPLSPKVDAINESLPIAGSRQLVARWRGVFVYFEGKRWNESCHHVMKPAPTGAMKEEERDDAMDEYLSTLGVQAGAKAWIKNHRWS